MRTYTTGIAVTIPRGIVKTDNPNAPRQETRTIHQAIFLRVKASAALRIENRHATVMIAKNTVKSVPSASTLRPVASRSSFESGVASSSANTSSRMVSIAVSTRPESPPMMPEATPMTARAALSAPVMALGSDGMRAVATAEAPARKCDSGKGGNAGAEPAAK